MLTRGGKFAWETVGVSAVAGGNVHIAIVVGISVDDLIVRSIVAVLGDARERIIPVLVQLDIHAHVVIVVNGAVLHDVAALLYPYTDSPA
jgi:hypothetical protein